MSVHMLAGNPTGWFCEAQRVAGRASRSWYQRDPVLIVTSPNQIPTEAGPDRSQIVHAALPRVQSHGQMPTYPRVGRGAPEITRARSSKTAR